MDILNIEFSCKDELLILPKHYCTLDSEYNFSDRLYKASSECRTFSNVQFMHFNKGGKPWTRGVEQTRDHYLKTYEPVVVSHFKKWFEMAHENCPTIIKETLGKL